MNMKRLGMLGGMSYESTQTYYQIINQEINRRLKKSHSAELVIYSFDYAELERLLEKNDWNNITNRLVEEALKLKMIGAKAFMMCANTMHHVAFEVEKQVGLPLIHIVKETYHAVQKAHITKVGLIGTMYTMQSEMYPHYFLERGIEVITPQLKDQQIIHDIIYKELIVGIFKKESREKILEIIASLGVEGIILGCTELPLLILDEHLDIYRFDTLAIHAKAAANFMLEDMTYDL